MCCVFVCVLFVNECVMLYGLVFEVLLAFACAIINVCVLSVGYCVLLYGLFFVCVCVFVRTVVLTCVFCEIFYVMLSGLCVCCCWCESVCFVINVLTRVFVLFVIHS